MGEGKGAMSKKRSILDLRDRARKLVEKFFDFAYKQHGGVPARAS